MWAGASAHRQLGGQGATGEQHGARHTLPSAWINNFTSYMQVSMTKVMRQGSGRAVCLLPSIPSPLRSHWQEQQRRWS